MNIELGFYRGTSIVSKLIKWQTWSQWSHVSGRNTETGKVIQAWNEPMYEWKWKWGIPYPVWVGGSVYEDDTWFERHKPETIVDVFIDEELKKEWAIDIWNKAVSQIGKKYDFTGVFRFISRKPGDDEDEEGDGDWFCSQLWNWAWKIWKRLLKGVRTCDVSPGAMAMCSRLHYIGSVMRTKDGVVTEFMDEKLVDMYNKINEKVVENLNPLK